MMGSNGYRKGQYFSFDAIVASVIFVLTLVMLFSYWYSVRTYLDFQANDLNKEAARLSGLLFSPPSGDCGSIRTLGLANSWSDKRMNATLLDCASGMTEDQLKSSLGAAYNVSIVVTDMYDTTQRYVMGQDPADAGFASGTTEVSKLARVGTIATSGDNHMATVELYVYR